MHILFNAVSFPWWWSHRVNAKMLSGSDCLGFKPKFFTNYSFTKSLCDFRGKKSYNLFMTRYPQLLLHCSNTHSEGSCEEEISYT